MNTSISLSASAALQKRLNYVFQNCEFLFIFANAKSTGAGAITKYICENLEQVVPQASYIIQKVSLPKSCLNSYLNMNLSITGCRVDLLVFCRATPSSIMQGLDNDTSCIRLVKAHTAARFLDIALKWCGSPWRSQQQSSLWLTGLESDFWQFNQLLGAYIKKEKHLFYVSSLEIKQILKLQEFCLPHLNLENVNPNNQSLSTTHAFCLATVTHSFQAIHHQLKKPYLEKARVLKKLLQNLVFLVHRPQYKLVLALTFITREQKPFDKIY